MFKINSFENELIDSMKNNLIANQVEDTHGFNKLAKAIDYLNHAADIFENAGMHTEAAEITEILTSFAGKKKSSKPKSSESKSSKSKSSEPKQLSLFETEESKLPETSEDKPTEMVVIELEAPMEIPVITTAPYHSKPLSKKEIIERERSSEARNRENIHNFLPENLSDEYRIGIEEVLKALTGK